VAIPSVGQPGTRQHGVMADGDPALTRRAAILIALGANIAVAVAKGAAAALTGSSAMLAEALHSAADSSNEVLLLVGAKRSV
jgi:divalent metal cation (Fe/Co/Zn/Cd) transporter